MKERDTISLNAIAGMLRLAKYTCAIIFSACLVLAATTSEPPLGKLVDLGGHRLHVNCTGEGSPTVVVENGLGDFSFDWILVQSRVSRFSRICTYDRAGYAWSDPGPKPRTFAQANLELRDALSKLGEPGPFVLVGHSYGGAVVRNFATTYPHDVSGIVLVDASFEGQRVGIGGKKTIRLGDGAKGISIPSPHEDMKDSDKPVVLAHAAPQVQQPLDPMYKTKNIGFNVFSLPEILRSYAGEVERKVNIWAPYWKRKKSRIPTLVALTRQHSLYERIRSSTGGYHQVRLLRLVNAAREVEGLPNIEQRAFTIWLNRFEKRRKEIPSK